MVIRAIAHYALYKSTLSSCILSFRVHVKLFYRIVSYRTLLHITEGKFIFLFVVSLRTASATVIVPNCIRY